MTSVSIMTRPSSTPRKQHSLLSERMYVRIGKREDHQAQILEGTHRIHPTTNQHQVQVKWIDWSNEIEWVDECNILRPVLHDLPPRHRRTPLTAAEEEEERVKKEIQRACGGGGGGRTTQQSPQEQSSLQQQTIDGQNVSRMQDVFPSAPVPPLADTSSSFPRQRFSPRTPQQSASSQRRRQALPERLTDEQFKKALYLSDIDDEEEDEILSIKEDKHDDSYEQEDEDDDDDHSSSSRASWSSPRRQRRQQRQHKSPIRTKMTCVVSKRNHMDSEQESDQDKPESNRVGKTSPQEDELKETIENESKRVGRTSPQEDGLKERIDNDEHSDQAHPADVAVPTRTTSPIRNYHDGPMRATFSPTSPSLSPSSEESNSQSSPKKEQPKTISSPKNERPSPISNQRKRGRQLFDALDDSSDDQAHVLLPPSGQSPDDAIELSSDDEKEDYEYQQMKKRLLKDRQSSLSSLSEVSMPKVNGTKTVSHKKASSSPPQRVVLNRSSPDTSITTTTRTTAVTTSKSAGTNSTKKKQQPRAGMHSDGSKPPPEVRMAEKRRQLELEALENERQQRAKEGAVFEKAPRSSTINSRPGKKLRAPRPQRNSRPPRKENFLEHLVVRYKRQKELRFNENKGSGSDATESVPTSQHMIGSPRRKGIPRQLNIRTVPILDEKEEPIPVRLALRMRRDSKKQQIRTKTAHKDKTKKRCTDKSPVKRKRSASPPLPPMERVKQRPTKKPRPPPPQYSTFDFKTEEEEDDFYFVEMRRKVIQRKARERWLELKRKEELEAQKAQQERQDSAEQQQREQREAGTRSQQEDQQLSLKRLESDGKRNSFDTQEVASVTSLPTSTTLSTRTLIYEGPPLISLDGGWPEGWVERRYARDEQQRNGHDSFYFPPDFDEYKFRSRQEVLNYLAVLRKTGDPKLAYKARKNRIETSKEATKTNEEAIAEEDAPLNTQPMDIHFEGKPNNDESNSSDDLVDEKGASPSPDPERPSGVVDMVNAVTIVDPEVEKAGNISDSTYDTAPEQMVTDVGLLTQRVSPEGDAQNTCVDSRTSSMADKMEQNSFKLQEDCSSEMQYEEPEQAPNQFLTQDPETLQSPFKKLSQTGATPADAIDLLDRADDDQNDVEEYVIQPPKVASNASIPTDDSPASMGGYSMAEAMAMLESDDEADD